MASLDWPQCPAVESVPGRRSGAWVFGAWVFKDTRMRVATVFENLEAGSDIEEIIEQFHVTREQIDSLMAFVARSIDKAPSYRWIGINLSRVFSGRQGAKSIQRSGLI